MATMHCRDCFASSPCGEGHLYVLELGLGIERHFTNQPIKGYVYVGSTGKAVEQRFQDNLLRNNRNIVQLKDAKTLPEDGQWKYNSPCTKLIRKHYIQHRPDLLYFDQNPIVLDNSADLGRLKRREKKLATRLRNRGWRVFGDHGVN